MAGLKVKLTVEQVKELMDGFKGRPVDVEASKRLKIKVGTLEIDLDGMGFGKVLLDGKSTPIHGAVIILSVGELPRVMLDVSLNHLFKDEWNDKPILVDECGPGD